jgi:arylsulfatase A-like enzyme
MKFSALVLALLGVVPLSISAATPRPNVLIILVDDMGWGDLGANGGAGVPTPRMDQLAREGMRATQFYVASPICSPSRCGIITGQFPARWRLTSFLQTREGNRECEQADFLDPRAPSLPRAFKAAGYSTAHVGKWHLGGGRDVTNAPKFAAYGYDIGLGTYESPQPASGLGLKTTPWGTNREPQQVLRHDRTRWMVDATLAFILNNTGRPWFVNLWLDDVHTPHRPSDEQQAGDTGDTGNPNYRAVLRETDRQIGRLLDRLEKLQLATNTIVILTGDNGPEPSFQRKRTGGLRGMKTSLYEGGIRTPFVVRWPVGIPAGTTNDSTVISSLDFFPTLCALARVPAPEGVTFDGENLSAVFRGEKSARTRPLFWEYGRKPAPAKAGIRAFPYPREPGAKSPNVAVRDGDWKLLVNASGTGTELYNLATDPDETTNLATEKPDVVRRLGAAALDWRKSMP